MPSDAEVSRTRGLHLVTGGTGFLGSALVRSLLARGATVRVLDDGSRGHERRLADLAGRVEMIGGDVRDADAVARAMDGVATLCHLAAINGTRHFYERPYAVLDVGVRGTLAVLDAAATAGVRDVLFMSSSEVYQTPPVVPTPEDVPATIPDVRNPRYSYAGSKLLGEQATLHHPGPFARRLIVRPHNVYGPDMGDEHVIPELTRRIGAAAASHRAEGPIDLVLQGDGSQTRAFVHVDDFTDGLHDVLDRGEDRGIYHIGTDAEVTIAELARAIAAAAGVEVALRPGRGPEGGTPRRCPDIARARALGYAPRVGLDAGLAGTVRWYLEHPLDTGEEIQ